MEAISWETEAQRGQPDSYKCPANHLFVLHLLDGFAVSHLSHHPKISRNLATLKCPFWWPTVPWMLMPRGLSLLVQYLFGERHLTDLQLGSYNLLQATPGHTLRWTLLLICLPLKVIQSYSPDRIASSGCTMFFH